MTPAVVIRPVRPEEYGEAGAVTARAYAEHMPADGSWGAYQQRLADISARAADALVLVAEVGGVIAGTATLELNRRIPGSSQPPPLAPDEAHLRMLGVDPGFRRQGIARLLLAGCIDHGRAHRKTRLTLDTTERMRAAQSLYETMGFVFKGTSSRIPGVTMLEYERRIAVP